MKRKVAGMWLTFSLVAGWSVKKKELPIPEQPHHAITADYLKIVTVPLFSTSLPLEPNMRTVYT